MMESPVYALQRLEGKLKAAPPNESYAENLFTVDELRAAAYLGHTGNQRRRFNFGGEPHGISVVCGIYQSVWASKATLSLKGGWFDQAAARR